MTRVPTLSAVRRWDTGHLIAAAAQWTSTASSWEDAFSALSREIASPGGAHWDGAAADRAAGRAAFDRLEAVGHADRLHAAAAIARRGAERIAGARRAVLDAVDTAQGAGFSVAEDFAVSPEDPVLTGMLASRLGDLVAADCQVASEITFATTGLQQFAKSPSIQPRAELPEDPQQFNDVWTSLSPREKDRVFQRDEAIGNHPGMPFAERDTYNRVHLSRLQTAAQADVDALQTRFDDLAARAYMGDHSAETTDAIHTLMPALAMARDRLDGYDTVRQSLEAGGGTPRLLGLIDDRGHAAVTMGDPDIATRTAIFVPGTGQDLAAIDDSSRKSRDMFQAALDADPTLSTTDVSVTTWVGYDRPMTLTEAAWPDRARSGGAALDSYLDGMHASHRGPAAVDTVIGHSYGSTLIGAAATGGHHLGADNVIAVGSPGMLSRHAGDLALDPGARVYAMTATNDPISLVTSLTLGADPNADDYGATRLATNPGSALPYSAGLLPGVPAHGSYWDEGNPGLANMGAVIAGLAPVAVRP